MTKHRKHAIHHANHSAANAQFIAQAATAAVQCEIATGTPAAITIAQAILESGWGRHHIGSANNYFGVKAQKKGDDVSWGTIATGYVDVNTREHFNGKDVTISQPFRSYSTMGDSFTDHGQFLANNGRYRQYPHDYAATGDARAFARGLQKAGYATDPKYAELLIGLIEKYKVTLKSVTVQDRYATFQVAFPFDPQTQPNAATLQALCLDLLKANGSWSYALVSTEDHIEIDVTWNKQARRISIDNHSI